MYQNCHGSVWGDQPCGACLSDPLLPAHSWGKHNNNHDDDGDDDDNFEANNVDND